MMYSVVAVLCLAVAAQAILPLEDHPLPQAAVEALAKDGAQYALYKEYTENEIKWGTESYRSEENCRKEAFAGLNLDNKCADVDENDLNLFYWHSDLKYAVKKFIHFIDDNANDKITVDELKNDFAKKAIKVALVECTYLKSVGLRESCFADQLLTYASLCLNKDDVEKFVKAIGGGKTKLGKDEVLALKHSLAATRKYDDANILAEELGAYHGDGQEVTYEEFADYVTQESINDDFRRCRTGTPDPKTGDLDYNNACLLDELIEYANDDLTEMDISVLFRAVDKDNNKQITKAEIDALPGVDGDEMVKKAMKLLDMSITTPGAPETGSIDYGEFRTYLKSSTVQLQMEKECIEKKKMQTDEMKCCFNALVAMIKHNHDSIWLVVPDIEQQQAFEILDVNNDGIIDKGDLKYDAETEAKVIDEMDSDDEGETVDLEEFNEYMDVPHMVYATGDCLMKQRCTDGRGTCYVSEIGSTMGQIKHLKDADFIQWFQYYDTKQDGVINKDDELRMCGELKSLFLYEMGQGDDSVTPFEFTWYAKQQQLSERYGSHGGKPTAEQFHTIVDKYIKDDITEYDTENFFDEVDSNDDHELSQTDFGSAWPTVKPLIEIMDGLGDDTDKTANFREFWLWLEAEFKGPKEAGKDYKKNKDVFEKECTQKIGGRDQQKLEIKCYAKILKEHPERFIPQK